MEQKEIKHKYNAIEKAIKILMEFQEDRPEWGVRDLSHELGFSPATVQRILQTLKSYDFVDQDPNTRHYFLGNVFYKFLHTINTSNRVTRMARRFIAQVAEQTRETVHLNILEGKNRICIYTLESTRNLRAGMPLGHKSPLYAGASAKCLLAFSTPDFIQKYLDTTSIEPLTENTLTDPKHIKKELAKIRNQGFAKSLGERSPGLGVVSAPILDHSAQVQASLSIALPELRFSQEEHLEQCIRVLVDTALAFSHSLGF